MRRVVGYKPLQWLVLLVLCTAMIIGYKETGIHEMLGLWYYPLLLFTGAILGITVDLVWEEWEGEQA